MVNAPSQVLQLIPLYHTKTFLHNAHIQ